MKTIVFLSIVLGSLLGSTAEAPVIELAGISHDNLCDSRVWKTSKDLPSFIDSMAQSWCDATYQDAIHHAILIKEELTRCNNARSGCLRGLSQCEFDRNATMLNFQVEISQLQQDFAIAQEELRAQVAYWKEKCQERITIAECNLQKIDALHQCRVNNIAEVNDVENPPVFEDHQPKLESLEEKLSICRLEKAYFLANQADDQVVVKLRKQVKRLHRLLTFCGAGFSLIAFAICIYGFGGRKEVVKNSPKREETMTVLTSEETQNELASMAAGRNHAKPLLTNPDGEDVFLLLVPFNPVRKRKFSLFGVGGDYTYCLESARITSRGSKLYVVLYDYNWGCAFSEAGLRSVQLKPEEICQKAVPSDVENLDVLVWIGSHFINKNGEAVLVKDVAWAHYQPLG